MTSKETFKVEEIKTDVVQPVEPVQSATPTVSQNFERLRESREKAEREKNALQLEIETLKNGELRELKELKAELREDKSKRLEADNKKHANDIEAMLKTEYPDMEKVVNVKSIEALKKKDPHFARILEEKSVGPGDLYHRAIAAYALIKKHNIYVEDKHQEEKQELANNMVKPGSSSGSSGGLAEFSEFASLNTEDRRTAIFRIAKERANG